MVDSTTRTQVLGSRQGGASMKHPRKRPLVLSNSAPPPPTETTRKLEKILNGGAKKRKPLKRQPSNSRPVVPKPQPSILVPNPLVSLPRKSTNALASRGGLANAPTFRKSTKDKMPKVQPARNHTALVKKYSRKPPQQLQAPSHPPIPTAPATTSPVNEIVTKRSIETERTTTPPSVEANVGTHKPVTKNPAVSSSRLGISLASGSKRKWPSNQTLPSRRQFPEIQVDQVNQPPTQGTTMGEPKTNALANVFPGTTPSVSTTSPPNLTQSLLNTNSRTASTETKSRTVNNDNFVRLNLRNSAGACRGARNKKSKRKFSKFDHRNNQDSKKAQAATFTNSETQAYVSRMTGLDPMDDYVDGAYNATPASKGRGSKSSDDAVPNCARHQRPCKLIVVKKNTTGNKGRKFYACSMPRGEQCDHFQWADDTLEAARRTLKNSSHSSFIARQVAAHVDRFRALTVPELREEAARRNLNKAGKKSQLLMRLAIWTRDEIDSGVPNNETENNTGPDKETTCEIDLPESDEDSSGDEGSTSSEEMDFWDDQGSDNENVVDPPKRNVERPPNTVESTLQLFGHSKFRQGQEWAIERCLNKKKSLLVAPTGFGKSLCYALPAALMDGVCVVVSPLISLIQDQLRSLPPRIPAATLSGSVSASATAAILDDVVRNRIKILFVSPERLASPSFRRLFRLKWNAETQQHERRFPPISLLCIDEAHCASQWAHNFRPCFLRFSSLLRSMQPAGMLAMTATAGQRVIDDICATLGIESDDRGGGSDLKEESNVLVIDKGRDNIDVACHFVESHEERLVMLSKILQPRTCKKDSDETPHSGSLAQGSVIVYVWRQRDTEVVAEYLKASGVTGGVVLYHGGMDATARSKAQGKFMRGKARVCVATVAFGMGIDKADVVGIVHMYLSSSPEHYLQEIGRAGRDGRPARAIALPMRDEVPLRHSLVHTNSISKSQIRSLLLTIRTAVVSSTVEGEKRSLHLALPVEALVLGCDCKAETIETLLSLVEQDSGASEPLLHVEGFNYDSATIALKKRSIVRLAEMEPLAKCIQQVGVCCDPPIGEGGGQERETYQPPASFQQRFLAYSQGSYLFSVANCANHLGPSAEPRHVYAALRRLQNSNELELALDTTAKGRAFHIQLSAGGVDFFSSEEFAALADALTDKIHDKFCTSIEAGASKVLDMYCIMHQVAVSTSTRSEASAIGCKSSSLKRFRELTSKYFESGLKRECSDPNSTVPEAFSSIREREVENDVAALLVDLPLLSREPPDSEVAAMLGDPKASDYAALVISKFLHALDSPRAPMHTFRTNPMFGKWRDVHFQKLWESVHKYLTQPYAKAT